MDRAVQFVLLMTLACPCLAAAPMAVPLERNAELSTFYVHVDAGRQSLGSYLVDTGASHMTISRSNVDVLIDAGMAAFVRDVEGTTADGRTIHVPLYRLSEITLDGGCIIRDVEAAVLPGTSRELLGLSVLAKAAPFVFSMNPPQLELNNCGVSSEAAMREVVTKDD
jgi:hypothetical protein